MFANFFEKIIVAFESLSVNMFLSRSYSLEFLHSQVNILLLGGVLQLGQKWFHKPIIANNI